MLFGSNLGLGFGPYQEIFFHLFTKGTLNMHFQMKLSVAFFYILRSDGGDLFRHVNVNVILYPSILCTTFAKGLKL